MKKHIVSLLVLLCCSIGLVRLRARTLKEPTLYVEPTKFIQLSDGTHIEDKSHNVMEVRNAKRDILIEAPIDPMPPELAGGLPRLEGREKTINDIYERLAELEYLNDHELHQIEFLLEKKRIEKIEPIKFKGK